MKKTPENLVKSEIKDWLDMRGWFHFSLLQGLGACPGLPDLIAVKNGMVLFIEVKSDKGRLTNAQTAFAGKITGRGGHYIVARGYEDIVRFAGEE
jgi:Holliday junction resolvase